MDMSPRSAILAYPPPPGGRAGTSCLVGGSLAAPGKAIRKLPRFIIIMYLRQPAEESVVAAQDVGLMSLPVHQSTVMSDVRPKSQNVTGAQRIPRCSSSTVQTASLA